MINAKMQDAINHQIHEEIFSSYLYLSMSTYFEDANLPGHAHWLRLHAQEEMFHAMKLYYHVVERGGKVDLKGLKDPKTRWTSPINVFEEALEHEHYITKCIHDLMDLAIEEKDHASKTVLNWFVEEQVEEEDRFGSHLERLRMIGDHQGMLLREDEKMAARQPGPNPYLPAEGEE